LPIKTVSNIAPNNKESVYHLVHNKNNKNDNTLKKRNALVTFEFKTLLNKVSSPSPLPLPTSTCIDLSNNNNDEDKLNNEIVDLLPNYIYNEESNHFNINIPNNNQSPPTFSSSSNSSTSSANNSSSSSASSSSSSSQQIDNNDHFRTVSPSQLVQLSPILISPTSTTTINHKSEFTFENKRHLTKSKDEKFNTDNKAPTVTIWREELNAKNNYQQQLKKKVNF
jgi:hypothetical protein